MTDLKAQGRLARKIVIEVDDKGTSTVTAWDYMVASGTTPENMTMLALPQRRPTDTRMVISQLIQVLNIQCQGLFASIQQMIQSKGGANGTNETQGH